LSDILAIEILTYFAMEFCDSSFLRTPRTCLLDGLWCCIYC